ncbi:MAG TPA: hypothetical protein H9914_12580 [Candidatus Blautia avicola]|uniref:Uncharacterized protein n=1 Tax=Candidatus Blautia avicola TaxID=2838483 RepID=A0A9D2QXH7_9FIRM|nr:hypothetical protein [Candidatus Blautia avicola]
MHRTSITEALLGTVVLFNTVFEMPEEPMIWQIFSWLVVFVILIWFIETARDWENRIKKKVRRAGTQTDSNSLSRL